MKEKLIPTLLIEESERPPLPTEPAVAPGWGGTLASVLQLLRLFALLIRLRFRRLDPRDKAVRVRKFIEHRGGLWVKTAQILASRQDALPRVYCDELGKLFDSATAFPGEQSRRVAEKSLGRPLDEVFSEFSDEAIAAASIGQTHVARLRWNGTKVAVKVRRPYAVAAFQRDLKLFKFLTGLLARVAALKHLRPAEMYDELETMVREELDYRIEATSVDQMRKSLKTHKVHVPRVYFRFCTKDVLVMSFIDGVLMSDYLKMCATDPVRVAAWREENNVVAKKVARRIFMSYQRQVYEDNLFHGDLHPGNVMLLRNSRLAFLDFGSVGSLDGTFRKQLLLYNQLLTQGDMSKAILLLICMATPVPNIDLALVIRKLVRLGQHSFRFMAAKGVPYLERVYSDAMSQQIQVLGQARIPVSWEMLRMQRTLAVAEMSIRELDPSLDPIKLARDYFREAEKRRSKGEFRRVIGGLKLVVDEAGEILQSLSHANVMAAKQTIVRLESRVAQFVRHLVGLFRKSVAAVTLLLIVLMGMQHYPDWVPALVENGLSWLHEAFPRMTPPAWIALLLVMVVIHRVAGGIRRHFD